MLLRLYLWFCLFSVDVFAQNSDYNEPHYSDIYANTFKNLYLFTQHSFAKDNISNLAYLGLSTGLLIYYDQDILDFAIKQSKQIGFTQEDNTKTVVKLFDILPIRLPTDIESAVYFLGDGWVHFGFSFGYMISGKIYDDWRAVHTGYQLFSGIVSTAIVVQILKHTTGRESPTHRTVDRGVWRFFPNQTKYYKNVPFYDAFPSGHIATSMLTVTIIADNYPEHTWIRPVGYTLMTLLGAQMLNNSVHWASDYPLGIAIGYSFAKIVTSYAKKPLSNATKSEKSVFNKYYNNRFSVRPYVNQNSFQKGIKLVYDF